MMSELSFTHLISGATPIDLLNISMVAISSQGLQSIHTQFAFTSQSRIFEIVEEEHLFATKLSLLTNTHVALLEMLNQIPTGWTLGQIQLVAGLCGLPIAEIDSATNDGKHAILFRLGVNQDKL